MSKVDQQDELDDDEDEGAHHAKVVPHCENTGHILEQRFDHFLLPKTNTQYLFKMNFQSDCAP